MLLSRSLTYYISSASNISKLEDIRTNNLRLAHSVEGTGQTNIPAIIWMSNNVHGNEASSAKASMMTLFELVNLANTKAKTWVIFT